MAMLPAQEVGVYSSPYLAEIYDILAKPIIETHSDDSEILFTAFKSIAKQRATSDSAADPVTILDVGCGTGRVLDNLIKSAIRENLNLSNVHFIGIDNESSMIDVAKAVKRQSTGIGSVGRVDWVIAEASKLDQAPVVQDYLGKVDYLIFSVGSIAHLTGPGETHQFMVQAAKLLRPKIGRAYISLLEDREIMRLIAEQNASHETATEMESQDITGHKVPDEIPSELHEGVIYKFTQVENPYIQDNYKTERFSLQVFKQAENKSVEMIENDSVRLKGNVWSASEFIDVASDTGLRSIKTFTEGLQTFYVFESTQDEGKSN